MKRDRLIIGNCSGFFGDRQSAATEVLTHPGLDVLTGDWLAELTMLILQKQKSRDPLKGFAPTFVAQLEQVLGTCVDRGVKIVSNAGGVNPSGCAEQIQGLADKLGIRLSIGTVSGDDLTPRAGALAQSARLTDLAGGPLTLSGQLLVANAYLGGWGIAACLEGGADVVVTGRVTDAALVSGPSAWAFGWAPDEWDKLAGAVAAGHVIECGAQATGGNFPFFAEIDTSRRIGFPIAEIRPDGSSVITKVNDSGGAVTVDTVKAQLLYEVQSTTYHNADVSVQLDSIELQQAGQDRVLISCVRGAPPPHDLKVSIGTGGGWRNSAMMVITGPDEAGKAAFAERALWDLIPGGREAFNAVSIELIGRPRPDPVTMGEAVSIFRIAVCSDDEHLAGRSFSSAVVQTALASYPGFYLTAPPSAASSYAVYVPALVDANEVEVIATVGGNTVPVRRSIRRQHPTAASDSHPRRRHSPGGVLSRKVPLGSLCGARSGDKGGDANIGIWVRDARLWPWLRDELDEVTLGSLLPGGAKATVRRYELPNLLAVNFVIGGWLGDGVSSNLALDSQAKGLGEYVRSRLVAVPTALLDEIAETGP